MLRKEAHFEGQMVLGDVHLAAEKEQLLGRLTVEAYGLTAFSFFTRFPFPPLALLALLCSIESFYSRIVEMEVVLPSLFHIDPDGGHRTLAFPSAYFQTRPDLSPNDLPRGIISCR